MTLPVLRVYIELKDEYRQRAPSGVVTFRSDQPWDEVAYYINPEKAKNRWVMREDTGDVWIPHPYELRSNRNPGARLTDEQAKEFLLIQLRAQHV